MATVIRDLVVGYRLCNEKLADPRTKDFLMIGTPWPVMIVVGLYLYFVCILGPELMKKRQPLKLDRILQMYNVFQIGICAFIFYKAMELAWLRDYSYICQPVDYSNSPRALEITRMVWLYFIVKNVDLLETVFFVLRKKQNQVTFLHVYHHFGMVLGTWFATKYLPGGHITFLGLINSFVHVIMYTHYLLSSMKVNTNRWKKYITQLQLLQFFLIALHYAQLLWVDCDFPIWVAAIMVPQNFFMMVLFGEFYYNTYIKKKTVKKSSSKIKMEINGNIVPEALNGKSKEK